MPKKFRKLPVIIEAIQYDGSGDSAEEIIDWMESSDTARFAEWEFSYADTGFAEDGMWSVIEVANIDDDPEDDNYGIMPSNTMVLSNYAAQDHAMVETGVVKSAGDTVYENACCRKFGRR